MRVLLVNPPMPDSWYNDEFYLPSSMLYLAAALRENGDAPFILDMKVLKAVPPRERFYEEKLIEAISRFRPELIGFGCLFSGNFPDVLRFATCCKERFPSIPIVAGGIHFTIHAEKIMRHAPVFDLIVRGEGERALTQLVDALRKGRTEFDGIDGVVYRKGSEVVVNPKQDYIADLDRIPFPAYDLIALSDYHVDTSAWHNPRHLPILTSIPIISSRSCPHRCSFCSMYTVMGPRWRARSPQNVVSEMELLYQRYGYRHFSFMDDNITLNKPRTIEICRLIRERGLDIQFETPNGLNLNSLDAEVIDALVGAGLVRVALAIESGSDYMRNTVMKKRLSREKILEVLGLVRRHPQLHVSAFFIIGMPEETHESLRDTYDMIQQVEADKIQLMNIVPFPHTEVFDQAVRDNLLVDLDPEILFMSGDLYFKNVKRFFIKPYGLELSELFAFRRQCEELIQDQQRKRTRPALSETGAPCNG
jgi:anaerobic magnesium-protoporphyrin IX monomethyl ester cyclase